MRQWLDGAMFTIEKVVLKLQIFFTKLYTPC
jgi:hypothetical protein